MNLNPQVHLTTGQFAKLMDISKDTLLYYDKVGIFPQKLLLLTAIGTIQFIKQMFLMSFLY
ncbi:hypothetical protein J2S74_004132 [Evansella vedderi]|uniref:HTH merR-type domain-containing protein n=1 Tax=Evansella vedderi TaxID=38282 RepID=A0ABT9ZZN8_9BACI|nr:MerR family DNA-binding transcriptional regulator [Evansella vedderi]MDQ0256710.1 hypothetical protein [Evansella vedderi]